MPQTGLFDFFNYQERLSRKGYQIGTPERINRLNRFSLFADEEGQFKTKGAKLGRPSGEEVLLFKILALANLCSLTLKQLDYPVKDRLSFMRFARFDLRNYGRMRRPSGSFPEAVDNKGCWTSCSTVSNASNTRTTLRMSPPIASG